jgi:FMN phosphatase YigB (HAD superfamily)
MAAHAIRLVCFDLGGVLLRICRSWREGCQAAGLPLRLDAIDDPSGANGWREISRRYQTGLITCDHYFRDMAASTNHRYSAQEIQRIHHAWILGEYDGIGRVIDRIHDCGNGVRTACLSNVNHSHWSQMPRFPSVMKLHHRLASHEIGTIKPDAAAYRELELRTSIAGEQILFFDDLPENIAAARQLGWVAHEIDPLKPTDAQMMSTLDALRIGARPQAATHRAHLHRSL